MNAETFCEHFAKFADAPNGTAKLRELILQLAVQGKLVPQDKNDEPASEVVRRINAARGLKKAHQDSPADIAGLPQGWVLVRMGQITDHRLGKMLDNAKNKGELFPYLRNTNVQWWRFALDDLKEMRFVPDELREYEVRIGDLLVCEGGEPGRCAVWNDTTHRLVFQKAIHRVRPLEGISPYFLAIRLRLDALTGVLDRQFTGATIKHFTGQELARYAFPLPPLAEQRRIVEKVDQLLGLCDELAARQVAQREKRQRLVGATLDRLVSTHDPAEFPTHAHRLRNHFDQLFDTPTTIPQLRQTILQLAIQGKLVTQDPNDEPASVLVEKISNFKANVTGKPSKIPSLESLPNDVPLPNGWIAARFGDIMVNRDGERIPVSRDIREGRKGPYDYYGASGVIDCIDDFLFDKPLLLIGEDGANLINRSTPIAFIAEGKYWVNNHAHVLDGISVDFLRYIELHINAIDLKPFVTGTAQPKMNQAKMNSIPIAIPPAAEQKRIVTKVTELLSLCDALEAKLTQAESASTQLLSAAVHHLLQH
jgi:type I restriction enzyme S subunit